MTINVLFPVLYTGLVSMTDLTSQKHLFYLPEFFILAFGDF